MRLRTLQRIDYMLGGAGLVILRPLVWLFGRVLRRDHHWEPQGDIGVLKLVGGGSLVLAGSALLGLRSRYRDRRLVLFTTPQVLPFARTLGVFDELVVIDPGSAWSLVHTALTAWARAMRLDTVLDLEPYSRLTTVFATLSAARNRIGFFLESTFWREGLSTHLVFFNRRTLVELCYNAAVRVVGAMPAPRPDVAGAIKASIASAVVAETADDSEGGLPRLCLAPACSSFGRERMLTGEQWMRVLEHCLGPEVRTVSVVGAREDGSFAKTIVDLGRERFPTLSWDNACDGRSLEASVRTISQSRYFLSVDSSLLHFARLLGVPSRSVWGPTDPGARLDRHSTAWDRVYYCRTPCSPCIHVAETAPCAGANLCIEAAVLSMEDLAQGVEFAARVPIPTFRLLARAHDRNSTTTPTPAPTGSGR